jgi:NAD(P)-dependent dehydrogenase (short-subunit alcohol dehydrogenase family)
LEDFAHPITSYTRTHFLTAKAVSRHMAKQGSGAILTIAAPGSELSVPGFLGYGVACGAVEAFSRILARELGPHGIRVVCLQVEAIPEALGTSHMRKVFSGVADRLGISVDALLAERAKAATLRRLPTLAEVANYAAFVASDRAGAMTGAIANLTCGSLVD